MTECFFGAFGVANKLTSFYLQQMRAVGHKLRERYVESEDTKLFSTSDTPSEILHDVSIRSTDSRRTVETVYELILGLTNAKKPEELKKPIEIHVLDASEETMYPRTACEQMKQHFRDSKHNPEFVKAKKEAFGYMDFTQMTPEEERYWKSRAIPAVCNTLSSMTAHKFPLPGVRCLNNSQCSSLRSSELNILRLAFFSSLTRSYAGRNGGEAFWNLRPFRYRVLRVLRNSKGMPPRNWTLPSHFKARNRGENQARRERVKQRGSNRYHS
jgi:hypothetical protein